MDLTAQLGITVRTVESHRAKIMLKLDLHSLADLIHYAIRQGLYKGLGPHHPISPHEDRSL
jgi:DNA-binding CsgD family transcriptional regulator